MTRIAFAVTLALILAGCEANERPVEPPTSPAVRTEALLTQRPVKAERDARIAELRARARGTVDLGLARPKSASEAEALINDPGYQEAKAAMTAQAKERAANLADRLSLTGTRRLQFEEIFAKANEDRLGRMDIARRNRGAGPLEARALLTTHSKPRSRLPEVLGAADYARYLNILDSES